MIAWVMLALLSEEATLLVTGAIKKGEVTATTTFVNPASLFTNEAANKVNHEGIIYIL